jgi:hypothetical protein
MHYCRPFLSLYVLLLFFFALDFDTNGTTGLHSGSTGLRYFLNLFCTVLTQTVVPLQQVVVPVLRISDRFSTPNSYISRLLFIPLFHLRPS